MGGFFSTRWNHVRTRQDTDSLLYLDVRWLARLAGKSARLIRAGNVSPDDDDLTKARETFSAGGGQHLYYVQGNASTSVETIRAALAHLQRTYPGTLPVVMIDFLQRLAVTSDALGRGSGFDDMRGRVGLLAQRLRDLATETGAHVWAISSTNRAAYLTEKATPNLASARESGDIEFAADAVVTIAPGEGFGDALGRTDPLEMKVVKNRHGETATISLQRDRTSLRIAETDTRAGITTYAGAGRRAST